MTISFRQIRYFIATAEAGQVSQAAANLSVSQSAVTSAIRSLEELLECRLFDRHSNGVTLSYDGHQFLQHARNIDSAVFEATRTPAGSGRSTAGTLNIGVTYTVAGYFLPPLLARFSRTFPNIEPRLYETHRQDIERRLVTSQLDLAVMLVSNLENRDELESDLLISSRRRLWTCADHPLLQLDKVQLSDIATEPYLMLTVDEAEESALRYWRETKLRPNTIFRTSSVEAVRGMVASGAGVTILSDMVYRPWSLEGQRVEVRNVHDPVHSMDVGIVWPKSRAASEAALAFREYLTASFSSSFPQYPQSAGRS